MWTPDDVRARFYEATDIERRVVVKGIPGTGNGWPTYRYNEEDRAGWDDAARLDDLERWKGRKFTTSAEQSRWQEVVFEWRALIPLDRRNLIWDFAEIRSRGWSFSKYCEDRGLVRMTAYRRVDRVLENLAKIFTLEARSLRLASDKWVLQSSQIENTNEPIVENCGRGRQRIHPAFISEKSTDTLKTPEAMAAFVSHMENVNDRRRKTLMRRLTRDVSNAA